MTRTTLDLDPDVLHQLKARSERDRKPMGQVASELLVRALAEKARTRPPAFAWVSRDLGEPLIDLEDKEAIRAVLDSR